MRHMDITIDVWDVPQDTLMEQGVSLLEYLGAIDDAEIERITAELRRRGRATHAEHTIAVASNQDRTPQWWAVAVYLVDLAYGGPEEGGWYYETGELVLPPVGPDLDGITRPWLLPRTYMVDDHGSATAYLKNLQDMLDGPGGPNHGRPSIGSVLSRGRYQAVMCQGFPVAGWPAERPTYE